jgi:hypothetical protein
LLGTFVDDDPWNYSVYRSYGFDALTAAAAHDQIHVVEYLVECGFSTASGEGSPRDAYRAAIRFGHTNVVRFLCDTTDVLEVDLERIADDINLAVSSGHFTVAKYLYELLPEDELSVLAEEGVEEIEYLFGDLCACAAELGHLEMVKYFHETELRFPMDERTCAAAAQNGHLDLLRWVRSHGCPWDDEICAIAAEKGYVES